MLFKEDENPIMPRPGWDGLIWGNDRLPAGVIASEAKQSFSSRAKRSKPSQAERSEANLLKPSEAKQSFCIQARQSF